MNKEKEKDTKRERELTKKRKKDGAEDEMCSEVHIVLCCVVLCCVGIVCVLCVCVFFLYLSEFHCSLNAMF